MQEIFKDVSQQTKEIADLAWRIATVQPDPIAAANFLDMVTNYYDKILSENEIEFLRFYFNMKMEMMKE